MTIYYTDIYVKAHSREVLERVLDTPYISPEAFTDYYGAKLDDRTYLMVPKLDDSVVQTVKLHTSTRGLVPIGFFDHVLEKTGEDLEFDFMCYPEHGGHYHYQLSQNGFYRVYDQRDFEIDLEHIHDWFEDDPEDFYLDEDRYSVRQKMGDENAPIEFGEQLHYPENFNIESLPSRRNNELISQQLDLDDDDTDYFDYDDTTL